jgi:fumarate reductase flavoprotein subunit
MKYGIIWFVAVLFSTCVTVDRGSTAKKYDGYGEGYRGQIHVTVWFEAGSMVDIAIEDTEDARIGGVALAELRERVLEVQSTELDAVSGATESSVGFLAAVDDALSKKYD